MTSRLEKNKKQRDSINISVTKDKTKKIGIKVFSIIFKVFLAIAFIYIIIRYIGNLGLVVREYPVTIDNLNQEFYGMKIVQISDLNYNSDTVDINKVRKVVKKVNSINPDIIVFTGNLIYGNPTTKEKDDLTKMLSSLNATYGKYEVLGKYDNDDSLIILNNSGFINLNNNNDLIYKDSTTPIALIGFGNKIDKKKAFNFEDNNYVKIGIINDTKEIDNILEYNHLDIILSGYTLNGQITLPSVGGLFDYNRKYFNKTYNLEDTKIFVSGGVGTRKYPFRLFNHPSINLIRIK